MPFCSWWLRGGSSVPRRHCRVFSMPPPSAPDSRSCPRGSLRSSKFYLAALVHGVCTALRLLACAPCAARSAPLPNWRAKGATAQEARSVSICRPTERMIPSGVRCVHHGEEARRWDHPSSNVNIFLQQHSKLSGFRTFAGRSFVGINCRVPSMEVTLLPMRSYRRRPSGMFS